MKGLIITIIINYFYYFEEEEEEEEELPFEKGKGRKMSFKVRFP